MFRFVQRQNLKVILLTRQMTGTTTQEANASHLQYARYCGFKEAPTTSKAIAVRSWLIVLSHLRGPVVSVVEANNSAPYHEKLVNIDNFAAVRSN